MAKWTDFSFVNCTCFNGVCVQFGAAELFSCPCGVLRMRLHAMQCTLLVAQFLLSVIRPSVCKTRCWPWMTLNDVGRLWNIVVNSSYGVAVGSHFSKTPCRARGPNSGHLNQNATGHTGNVLHSQNMFCLEQLLTVSMSKRYLVQDVNRMRKYESTKTTQKDQILAMATLFRPLSTNNLASGQN